MSKHTPGPWKTVARNYPIADTGDYDGCWEVLTGDPKKPIVQIWGDSDEDEANARLIAAAPDLLEALKNIVNLWDHHASAHGDGTIFPLHVAARAAIAKAEGAT
jgi:hypothetical protein